MSQPKEVIRMINVADCLPNPFERRQADSNIDSLAASMKASGLLYPIIARCQTNPTDGKVEVADGGRRVKAAKALGWTHIKTIVAELSDDEMQIYATVANLQREGLSMWEEIAEVKYLMDRKTMSVSEIGDKLGKPASWVAKRHRVSQLDAKLIATIQHNAPHITLDKLCELCIVEAEAISEMIKTNDAWRIFQAAENVGLQQFKDIVAELTHKLKSAPWSLTDETLVAAAGSCLQCSHRSGRNPSLFDQLEATTEINKNERCLKPTCWKAKHLAWVDQKLTAAKAQYPGLRVVSDSYSSKAEQMHHFRPAKKTDANAFPAFHIDDGRAGQIEYLRPWNHGATSTAPKKSMASLTEAERKKLRQATLTQKRQRVFVAAVKEEIRKIKQAPKCALALLLTFGSDEHANDARYNSGIWEDFDEFTTAKPADVLAQAWKMVKDVLEDRLNFTGTLEEITPYHADAVKLCEALGIDVNDLTAKAEKEIPTPKSLETAPMASNKPQPKKKGTT